MKTLFVFPAIAAALVGALPSLALEPASEPSPPLRAEPRTRELIIPAESTEASTTFLLSNTTPGMVKIGELRPSCRCMNVTVNRWELPPGAQSRVQVDLDLTGRPGPQQKSVDVLLETQPPTSVKLTISVLRQTS